MMQTVRYIDVSYYLISHINVPYYLVMLLTYSMWYINIAYLVRIEKATLSMYVLRAPFNENDQRNL